MELANTVGFYEYEIWWLHIVEWFIQHVRSVMLDLWYATDALMLMIMNYKILLRINSHSETITNSFSGKQVCVVR
jgi:hypothetical protein